MHSRQSQPPLVAHIIHRLAVGGLENGLINLINYSPPERYCHAVICLTDFTDFRSRIHQSVPVIALHKREGSDIRTYFRLWRVLRELRPAIVHTRNIGTLEYLLVAATAGVRGRIHGEHGRDVYDLTGSNPRYNLLRKGFMHVASCYTAVSQDLVQWLVHTVGVAEVKVKHIYNGVDVHRFHPRANTRPQLGPEGFVQNDTIVVGTVGRMQAVKDQPTLVRAFVHLIQRDGEARQRLRLVMIGSGPLAKECQMLLRTAYAERLAWLPGERSDIPEIMRALDIFVLPSLAEGISNTILEAMASGLPVVATRVGGNPELVQHQKTGLLVAPGDPMAMADAIRTYLECPDELSRHGQAGRMRVEQQFGIKAMVNEYMSVYDRVLAVN